MSSTHFELLCSFDWTSNGTLTASISHPDTQDEEESQVLSDSPDKSDVSHQDTQDDEVARLTPKKRMLKRALRSHLTNPDAPRCERITRSKKKPVTDDDENANIKQPSSKKKTSKRT